MRLLCSWLTFCSSRPVFPMKARVGCLREVKCLWRSFSVLFPRPVYMAVVQGSACCSRARVAKCRLALSMNSSDRESGIDNRLEILLKKDWGVLFRANDCEHTERDNTFHWTCAKRYAVIFTGSLWFLLTFVGNASDIDRKGWRVLFCVFAPLEVSGAFSNADG